MTEYIKTERWLKSIFVLTVLGFIVFFIVFTNTEIEAFNQIYQNEIVHNQSMVGAIVAEHPELEAEVVKSVLEATNIQAELIGQTVLTKYGYDKDNILEENSFYHNIQKKIIRSKRVLITGVIVLLGILIVVIIRNTKAFKGSISDILQSFIDGNYHFAAQKQYGKKNFSAKLTNRIETQLENLGKQIELKSKQLMTEKEETKALVTDISHQLKTPLASLKTSFELLTDINLEWEEREEFKLRSGEQIEKLEKLVHVLVNISRLETGLIAMKKEVTDLRETLLRAMNSVYGRAREKQIEIEVGDFEDINLQLDLHWTSEAIVNILDNAIKYSKKGSKINITVQDMLNFIRVEISDQGIGISKEEYNQIFKRFYRGKSELVKKEEGSGVGLYLTRKILEEQGSTIKVKSVIGEGSTFILQLRKENPIILTKL